MKLLLTGFDPFGEHRINPAWEAVKLVPDRVGDAEVIKLEVPTVFGESIQTVRQAMDRHRPQAVLCVGLAGGRSAVAIERVAINLDDARIPDNRGNQPVDQPIFADGQPAYFATVPVKAMAEEIRRAGLPAVLSTTAGTYVCNHLMYGVLYHISRDFPGVRGGFIHVPTIPALMAEERAPGASMALADIAASLEAAIRAIAGEEIHPAAGSIW